MEAWYYVIDNSYKRLKLEQVIGIQDNIVYGLDGLEATLKEDQSLREWVEENMAPQYISPSLELIKCDWKPGEYYPRISRPVFTGKKSSYSSWDFFRTGLEYDSPNEFSPVAPKLQLLAINQLILLVERLQQIFRVVHPDENNLSIYGPEIRNLIILAATEVEAQMKGIMSANNYMHSSRYSTTADYWKLKSPLKLESYSIKLTYFPWLNAFSPFANWESDQPTQSLIWYNAYNKIKHDRESNFEEATLTHAISAVIACAILLKAQYGNIDFWQQPYGKFFQAIQLPELDFKEFYLIPVAKKHPSSRISDLLRPPNREWKPLNYPF